MTKKQMLALYSTMTNIRREIVAIKSVIEHVGIRNHVESADLEIWKALSLCAQEIGNDGHE